MNVTDVDGLASDAVARSGYRDVAGSIVGAVETLVPGDPPFGERNLTLFREPPRVHWTHGDIESYTYRISVDSKPGNWQQFAYQLSHELGHVKLGPARSNLMLETFAEAIAVLAVTSLQKVWKDHPPFAWDGWGEYAATNAGYLQENMALKLGDLPQGIEHPQSGSVEDRIEWLRAQRDQVEKRTLQEKLSRAWQHVSAVVLVEKVFKGHSERLHSLLGLAGHTTPSAKESPTYQENLPIIPDAIPDWVPEWLR